MRSFNSSLVRLKAALAPTQADPEPLGFNSSLVRLKALPATHGNGELRKFQFQPGAIKGPARSLTRSL